MVVRAVITLLCAVGLYASIFMLHKSVRVAKGLVDEPSVVEQPQARLFAGLPNAAIGIIYYVALPLVIWLGSARWQIAAVFVASLLAAAVSAYLAYSLLFVTRMACKYCFMSHVVNALLVLCTAYVFKLSYWQ